MTSGRRWVLFERVAMLCTGVAVSLLAPRAFAQGPTGGEQPAESEADSASKPTTPEANPPAEPVDTQAAPVAAPPPPPPTPATPPGPAPPPPSLIPDGEAPKGPIAPAFPPAIPNIDFGARIRAGLRLQNPANPTQMNDIGESLDADLLTSGQIHRYLKWQLNLTLSYTGAPGSSSSVNVQPLDVIARIEPMQELNIYVGRMLVVADRFAPSGPWGMDEFFFPGFFPQIAAPALPKAGAVGRDLGVTVWGAPFAGHVKYYLGAFNLYDPALNPLLTGRLQVSLLSGEPAFYHRTTYFGTKDLVSLGIGGQYQKQGSIQNLPPTATTPALTTDYTSLTADVTFEKNVADAGTLSVVGAFYKFTGDYQFWKNFWVASLGYMLPKPLGIGKVRATVRYQRAMEMADGTDPSSIVDAQLSYNIAAWYARFALGYRRAESFLPPTATTAGKLQASNMAYLGITLADP